jgi:hypothetical protein
MFVTELPGVNRTVFLARSFISAVCRGYGQYVLRSQGQSGRVLYLLSSCSSSKRSALGRKRRRR